MTKSTQLWLVTRMLDGLGFPAQHWQLMVQAELNGVDAVMHERLRRLPDGEYPDCAAVASALDRDGHPDTEAAAPAS